MTIERLEVIPKWVDDLLVAGIRFQGKPEEMPAYFEQLYPQVEAYICGKGMVLYHKEAQSPGRPQEIEVCYPVSQAIESGNVKSHVLEGGPMLSTLHSGPYAASGVIGSRGETWMNFVHTINDNNIEIAMGPQHEIRLQDAAEHGQEAQHYLTELQIPVMLPRWLDRLGRGVESCAGEAARRYVMQGSEQLSIFSQSETKSQWVIGAMERLDATLDEQGCYQTMTGCAHRFPAVRIERMKAEFERLGDIDALIDVMRQDLFWYEVLHREGDILYVTKNPVDPEGHRNAQSEVEKRAAYCHCGMMRAAILAQARVSPTFCYCGAGWYTRLWQGILGQPVRIELLRSVMQGDEDCTFAIHLPQDVLAQDG
ncbi:MAG: GyrI-like domain-containing protein [Anaerolineales bacterium]|nr:GyrI-like domain-containing protein [Anaerolineales bacterium]